jgi:hypothetical protein
MLTAQRSWQSVRLRLLAAAGAALLPVVAIAQGADELALTIEQALAGIEFRIDVRPQQAAADLEAQGRQLDLLATEAPDHPALPELKQKYGELQDSLAASLAEAVSPSASPGGVAEVPSAPEAFTAGMQEVNALHRQAEAEFLRGKPVEASDYLEQAETQMIDLERRYGDELPAGHVPLLVAKEKIAALKDQLAEATPAD